MARRTFHSAEYGDQPAFPLCPDIWQKVLRDLHLSPQQSRIVELLLRRKKCKEIAAEIGLSEPTLRTYLRRIYDRLNVADQSELLIHIMTVSHRFCSQGHAHQRDDV